jgi:hypothetical protein
MWTESGERQYLEKAFSILRFRRQNLVSFRRFVILNARRGDAKPVRPEEAAMQPLRVLHR